MRILFYTLGPLVLGQEPVASLSLLILIVTIRRLPPIRISSWSKRHWPSVPATSVPGCGLGLMIARAVILHVGGHLRLCHFHRLVLGHLVHPSCPHLTYGAHPFPAVDTSRNAARLIPHGFQQSWPALNSLSPQPSLGLAEIVAASSMWSSISPRLLVYLLCA